MLSPLDTVIVADFTASIAGRVISHKPCSIVVCSSAPLKFTETVFPDFPVPVIVIGSFLWSTMFEEYTAFKVNSGSRVGVGVGLAVGVGVGVTSGLIVVVGVGVVSGSVSPPPSLSIFTSNESIDHCIFLVT